MSKTSKILIAVMVLAVLLLGIGYAAIQNVTLNITGSAIANPDQANFKVQFVKDSITVSDVTKVKAAVTDELNATINVSGLIKKGETVSATYTVQNASEDLSADLSVATTNSNTDYFTISSELKKTSLTAGEATTLTVTVELTKTLIESEEETATIGIQLTAMPVEPGQEGTSEGINGSSQSPNVSPTLPTTTLADLVTNDNIGDYIDLGNNIIGEATTTDDWRVFYVDEENDTVYAILGGYLPNSTEYAKNAGLAVEGYDGTEYTNIVYSDTKNTLITTLKTTSNWNGLANGINGANVIGTPTAELVTTSYNTKNGTSLDYTTGPDLDSSTSDYDLYVPSVSGDLYGYWMTVNNDDNAIWAIDFGGFLQIDDMPRSYAIRPVVSIPLSTTAELIDEVLTVEQ